MPEDSMIGRYLAAQTRASANGDTSLVTECEFQLRRLGYRPDATPPASDGAERRAEAEAKPATRPTAKRTK